MVKNKEAANEFIKIADEAFAQKTWAEWHQILLDNDIAHDKVNHMSEVLLDNPQTVANKSHKGYNKSTLLKMEVFVYGLSD